MPPCVVLLLGVWVLFESSRPAASSLIWRSILVCVKRPVSGLCLTECYPQKRSRLSNFIITKNLALIGVATMCKPAIIIACQAIPKPRQLRCRRAPTPMYDRSQPRGEVLRKMAFFAATR